MATMRQTYSEALKKPAVEKNEFDVRATEPNHEAPKKRKAVRFDLEKETSVTKDVVIVGDFTPKRTHPKSCLRAPAKFPTFGAEIRTYPPCSREFPARRRRATPKAPSKSWRNKYFASGTLSSSSSSDAGVGSSTDPAVEMFASLKLQVGATGEDEEEMEQGTPPVSPTVDGDFKKRFVDLFAPKPNSNGNTKDAKNLKSSNGDHSRAHLEGTTGGKHGPSSTIAYLKGERQEMPSKDNGYTFRKAPDGSWGLSQGRMTYADAFSRSQTSVPKGHWSW